ncbi:GNAT family N-acetyltransferase [uncultured Tateyamaria sp.]|uniref:GNAT family N-acetyltransferase n=1 Tax=uncultured Tateyamaria sp. TaxID=455651 RepID=UPI002627BE12|nr:GNAT family N-acetyltransferase [uncultured Tateyamaria sp.]
MTISIRSATFADAPTIARLCWAYRDLLAERARDIPGIVDTYYGADSYAALIDDLPRIHARPKGDILLAEADGTVVGCAMYYPLAAHGVTEIKRVFVDPAARGTGAGRALLQAALEGARGDGYTRAVLDTIAPLTEAIALYDRMGFAPCAPFYEPDPDFAPHLRFFDHPL